jgi:hypothetical protein
VFNQNVFLPQIGEYRIIKTLTVDIDGMLAGFEATLDAAGLLDPTAFVASYLEQVDLSGCFETCEDYCVGDWLLDYKQTNQATTAQAQAAWAVLSQAEKDIYLTQCISTECNESDLLDEIINANYLNIEGSVDSESKICDTKRQQMIDQLMPSGLFFTSVLTDNSTYVLTNVITLQILENGQENLQMKYYPFIENPVI